MSEHGTHIGLIGGLAIRAGIFYYEQIQRRYESDGRPLDLTLRHANVSKVLAYLQVADSEGLGRYLGGLSNELFDSGVDLVAISAIAPHMAIREITTEARGPVINVLEAVPKALTATGLERVAIFGNRAVMESGIYGSVGSAKVVRLEPAELEAVHTAYNDIALTGKRHTTAEVELLAGIADQALARGAQAVILAGTDLSSFYSDTPPDYPHINLAQTHIEQIWRAAAPTGPN